MSTPFSTFTPQDVRSLVAQHPLAWVCSGAEASQLPLIGEYDGSGRLVALIGHLARSNPLSKSLREEAGAMVLFSGPNAYVSPEHAGIRDWAPTWIYANLRIQTKIRVDAALTDYSLDVLIAAMESEQKEPWTREEIAHRYNGMARHIIGFRANVLAIEGRFKFGQDESDPVYRNIVGSLPSPTAVAWMRRFNLHR